MNILIIGTGNMGRGIATRALAGKNTVTLYDEDGAKAQALATELGARVAGDTRDAIAAADIVVVATPYAASLELAKRLGSSLGGKIVVDISNPLNDSYTGLVTSGDTSAAEEIRKLLPASAKLVKAFNTTFAPTLVAGQVAGQTLDVFLAGDDDAAKAKVAEFVKAGGLNAIDVGALDRARQLEALGLLGITLQFRLNTGFGTAWKLVLPSDSPIAR
ncbi:MAG: NAD(P)-binding domain-containing protein [Gemmatimonadaceae bacterium]|nr:NAD(P)-binding domain-containing protein [Gemmatimonadaceae bacterium]NUQ93229.1 NAD(P)-binding domain-containing protein [Gemmatimonadaceae bacterium]NUR18947.1 NAD(P)-binding domain-containing protein [Gemmatimonadaceae bacterium]NUS96189.1 NAD(P)-binding domain-containing protein [Gemmatimonadaceae bacterium]